MDVSGFKARRQRCRCRCRENFVTLLLGFRCCHHRRGDLAHRRAYHHRGALQNHRTPPRLPPPRRYPRPPHTVALPPPPRLAPATTATQSDSHHRRPPHNVTLHRTASPATTASVKQATTVKLSDGRACHHFSDEGFCLGFFSDPKTSCCFQHETCAGWVLKGWTSVKRCLDVAGRRISAGLTSLDVGGMAPDVPRRRWKGP